MSRATLVRAGLRRHRVLMLAALMFAGIFALRVGDQRPADAVFILCVVPIVLCAIDRGPVGGLIASLVGVALTMAWSTVERVDVGPVGYAGRSVAFLVVGLIVGRFAVERRTLIQRLGRRYDDAVDLHCTANLDGYFTSVNRAWTDLLGYAEPELLERPFVEFVHPDDRDATRREAARIATGDDVTVHFENRYRTRDGSYRWLAWTARSVTADDVIYATARDISGEHEQRELLERLVTERTRELEAERIEGLRRLALLAEYRDDDTHQHTERVGELAALLGAELGMTADEVERVRQATPLHDVGKIGIPDAILLKPGRLTDEERATMQRHTTMGAAILAGSRSPVLALAAEIAFTHHERWDGHGYPGHVQGDAIPLLGRVVAVADVFDALTRARPYKPAWPLHDAVAEIESGSGTQFDPRVVAAFRALHARGALEAIVADKTAALATASRVRHAAPV